MAVHFAHWECFYDHVDDFRFNHLPRLVKKMRKSEEYHFPELYRFSTGMEVDSVIPMMEDQGDLRHLAFVHHHPATRKRYMTFLFPFAAGGVVQEIRISQVLDNGNGADGLIVGSAMDKAEVSFFDPFFYKNRRHYQSGHRYRFSLAAVAYTLTTPDMNSVELDKDEDNRPLWERLEEAGERTFNVPLMGMSAYFQIPELGHGEYTYRVPARSVREIEFAGRKVYQMRAPLIQLDRDFEVMFYVSERVLTEGQRPKKHQDYQGCMWLQGYLVDHQP